MRRGWQRGESPQGGRYYTMERAGDGWSAALGFEPGIYLGAPTEEVAQSLQALAIRGTAPAAVFSRAFSSAQSATASEPSRIFSVSR